MITIIPIVRTLLHIPFEIRKRKLCFVSVICGSLLMSSQITMVDKLSSSGVARVNRFVIDAVDVASELNVVTCELETRLENSWNILSCS